MKFIYISILIVVLIIEGYSSQTLGVCGECPQDCEFGFAPQKSGSGCICVCAPSPCANKRCPENSTCQVIYTTNKPTGECFANNKAGVCPTIDYLKTINVNLHLADCEVDPHCVADLKCCPSPEGSMLPRVCIKPCLVPKCKCPADHKEEFKTNSKGCPSCYCKKIQEETKDDVCSLPKETGPCKASFKRFYYDTTSKKCQKFTYGGCKGNRNNFLSVDFCEKKCAPNNELKVNTTKCFLPAEQGLCKALFTRYFYNPKNKKCEEFIYGGCKGNENNFENEDECNNQCARPLITELKKNFDNKCKLEKDPGLCKAILPRFFYNTTAKECQSFSYGGCKGNSNNFLTIDECNKVCKDSHDLKYPTPKLAELPVSNQTKENVCLLDNDSGPCEAYIERYYYNKKTKSCEVFVYGGCDGNGNNFESLQVCQRKCSPNEKIEPRQEIQIQPMVVDNVPKDVCKLKPEQGLCKALFTRYYFNPDTNSCETFIYGGCKGNENNFASEEECKNRCQPKKTNTDKCLLDAAVGPCYAANQRYYFDKITNKCTEFTYGGCMGNENNFVSIEECQKECSSHIKEEVKPIEPPLMDICLYDNDPGLCKAYIERYFYNSKNKKCETFIYGGCMGNENNFESLEDCNYRCGTKKAEYLQNHKPTNKCEYDMDMGPCLAAFERYYYNRLTKRCTKFTYGGCLGNENNFETEEDCAKECSNSTSQRPLPNIAVDPVPQLPSEQSIQPPDYIIDPVPDMNDNRIPQKPVRISVCSLDSDQGPCKALLKRYFYNKNTDSCEEFFYGGCKGNLNRFEDIEACRATCPSKKNA